MKTMNSSALDLDTHFNRYGYIHVPSVIDPAEVERFRGYMQELFRREIEKSGGDRVRYLNGAVSLSDPKIYGLLFNTAVVDALKTILGPSYAMIPGCMVSRNCYGFSESGGWHWDSSSEGKQAYLHDADYRFVKCGIFMQDNTAEFGGGIDLVPHRHRWPLRTKSTNLNFKAKNLSDMFGKFVLKKRVEIRAGDFLAFGSCVPHRSTLPNALDSIITLADRKAGHIANMPEARAKVILYWDACRAQFAQAFMENNANREIREELSDPSQDQLFYSCFTSRQFPRDYPAEFISCVNNTGIQIPNLPKERSEDIYRRYERRLDRE